MLTVDTRNKRCSDWARKHQFDAGVMLMGLGFREITDKNRLEAEWRRAVWNGTMSERYPDLQREELCPPIAELMFIIINGRDETSQCWMSRHRKLFINDTERKLNHD